MEKKEQLYEGKAKKVFATDDPNLVIVSYKDDATAFNGEKKGTIAGKGAINNVMSNHMCQLLEQQGVPTHFVEQLSDRETVVKKVSIVPLEVIVRNISAGSFAKRYGVKEGIVFDEPTFEPVSYTHLDVYKRQPQRRPPPRRSADKSWIRSKTARCRDPSGTPRRHNGWRRSPSSRR